MVLRVSVVRLAISLIDKCSRKNIRRILAYMTMLITSYTPAHKISRILVLSGQNSTRITALIWSILNARQQFPLYLRHAALIAQASGLGHDFGKANQKFASKLLSKEKQAADKVRHEWISAWLIEHMNGNFSVDSLKDAWAAWKLGGVRQVVDTDKDNRWLPVERVDTAYDAMAFCVATHHRLLGYGGTTGRKAPKSHGIDKHINIKDEDSVQPGISECTIIDWAPWADVMDQLAAKYDRIKDVEANADYWRGVSIIARACLVLADHEVSSIKYGKKSDTDTWANSTRADNGKTIHNQPLTYHLDNVGRYAGNNITMFSGTDLPVISDDTRKIIEAPAAGEYNVSKYGWQDDSFNFLRERASKYPSLIFNVAGTGAGKTLGNVKILAALNPDDLRITAGFNLRTLTLQTRDAYSKQIGLQEDEIGCIVGGANNIIEKIHEFSLDDDEDRLEASEWNVSAETRNDLPDWLVNFHSKDKKDHALKLMGTPVIVTTMDHLIEAGEPGRQAGHALAMMRIASGDLIIDEADSYDPKSLMAVLRVIEIAAMFGRNIVVSSATLPLVLAEAISKAWRSGSDMCKALRNTGDGHIYCISNNIEPTEIDYEDFKYCYGAYVKRIGITASKSNVTKRFRIVAPIVGDNAREGFRNRIVTSIEGLHRSNNQLSGEKTVSIGLVRVANVTPCIQIAKHISTLNRDADIYVMTYHAKEVLARRAWKEKNLDQILTRKPVNGIDPDWWAGSEEIQSIINDSKKSEVIFVVVATPVAEVGRDHDYDWAIIEASSMTSILQTSGRVNRHRLKTISEGNTNIHILDRNWAYLMPSDHKNGSNCYSGPGHQIKTDKFNTHKVDGETMSVSALFDMPLTGDRTASKTMDVRLIFGDDKVTFAQEDDNGILWAIEGAMAALNDQKSWLNGWVYDNFQLREHKTQSEFIYDFNTGKIQKVEFSPNKYGKSESHLESTDGYEEEVLSGNTFFSKDMTFIHQWIKEKKISPEDLISLGSFSVTGKKDNPIITEFGITF